MHRCKVEIIPASKCKAEYPKVVCEKCTKVDVNGDGEQEVCIDRNNFDPEDPGDVSATC